jgi:hypothetical protein
MMNLEDMRNHVFIFPMDMTIWHLLPTPLLVCVIPYGILVPPSTFLFPKQTLCLFSQRITSPSSSCFSYDLVSGIKFVNMPWFTPLATITVESTSTFPIIIDALRAHIVSTQDHVMEILP